MQCWYTALAQLPVAHRKHVPLGEVAKPWLMNVNTVLPKHTLWEHKSAIAEYKQNTPLLEHAQKQSTLSTSTHLLSPRCLATVAMAWLACIKPPSVVKKSWIFLLLQMRRRTKQNFLEEESPQPICKKHTLFEGFEDDTLQVVEYFLRKTCENNWRQEEQSYALLVQLT